MRSFLFGVGVQTQREKWRVIGGAGGVRDTILVSLMTVSFSIIYDYSAPYDNTTNLNEMEKCMFKVGRGGPP